MYDSTLFLRDNQVPESTSYLGRVVNAAPRHWACYQALPAGGLANGILAVGRGFDSTLSADSDAQRISLWVLLADGVRFGPDSTHVRRHLRVRAKSAQIIPDQESHVIRFRMVVQCPNSPELPVIVRRLFDNATRFLSRPSLWRLIRNFDRDEPRIETDA